MPSSPTHRLIAAFVRSRCADYTIPLGAVPYYSPVTRVTEQLPVSINLAVRRGCDLVLFNLIDELATAGIVEAVKTGREAF